MLLKPFDEGDGTFWGQLIAGGVQRELGHGVALETWQSRVAVENKESDFKVYKRITQ